MAMLSIDYCARELESAVQLKNPKAKRRGIGSRHHVEVIRSEEEELRRRQAWGEYRPGHLVALWAWLYRGCYGVDPEPSELAPKSFNTAALFAGKALKESFGGDAARCVGFVRWVWAREVRQKRERPDGRRISSKVQFASYLISDWRLATAGKIA
jgi:hypothetical protein